jgi:phage terminase large subunit-like protein
VVQCLQGKGVLALSRTVCAGSAGAAAFARAKLANDTITHPGQRMMTRGVGNAKIEVRAMP